MRPPATASGASAAWRIRATIYGGVLLFGAACGITACAENARPSIAGQEESTLATIATACAGGKSDLIELVGYSPYILHDTPMSPDAFEAELKLVPPDYEVTVRSSEDIRRFADLVHATRGGPGDAGTTIDVRFRIRCGSGTPKDQWLYSDAEGDAIVGDVAFASRTGYWVGDFLRGLEASRF